MYAMRVSSLKRSSLYLAHACINIALSILGLVLLKCTKTREVLKYIIERSLNRYFRLFINYIITFHPTAKLAQEQSPAGIPNCSYQ